MILIATQRLSAHTRIISLQKFQKKFLGIVVDAPWCVTNDTKNHDFNVPRTLETR